MKYDEQALKFVEEMEVKNGVICKVYEFKDDNSKDLGIITVLKGNKTPLQKVLKGDKTLEIFESGKGILTITKTNGGLEKYEFPGNRKEVEVKVGEMMQWEAFEDLVFNEVCYPPYEDGRYENLLEE